MVTVERRRGRLWVNGREFAELGTRPCLRCGDYFLPNRGHSRVVVPRRVAMRMAQAQYQRWSRRMRRQGRPVVQESERVILTGRDAARRGAGEPDPRPADLVAERPRTRDDCRGGPRPCPWVSCRHHLYLEVGADGSIRLNYPELEPWLMASGCSLDVADDGGLTLEMTAQVMGVSRERIRQLIDLALRSAAKQPLAVRDGLRLYLQEDPPLVRGRQ